MRTVRVANLIDVADATKSEIIDEAVAAAIEAARDGAPRIVTALHIGGLNARNTPGFSQALAAARLVYADGIAVVILSRLSGAKVMERSATTDIGIPTIASVASRLERPARVGLLGGEDGVAAAAAAKLAQSPTVDIVYTCHGYQDSGEWEDRLAELRSEKPDVVLIGLGSPAELLFCFQHEHLLPASLVLTCGGWFGFLSGKEPRAPRLMQSLGLEWTWRLVNAPSRLYRRYARGMLTFVQLASKAIIHRVQGVGRV